MRKTAVVIAVAVIALFSFNEKELYKKDIRNRLIVQGIGIDRENDGSYTVTVQAINTSSQSPSLSEGGGDSPVKTYTVSGDTVYTALKSVTEYEGKIPLFSQNRVIIIGRPTAEKGIEGIVDFFVRDVENSASVRVATADGKASEILRAEAQKGEITARNIELSIRAAEYDSEIAELELYELINRYNDESSAFAMPVVALKDGKRAEIKETAVFKDGKLKATISPDDTVMLRFLLNDVGSGEFSFETKNDEKSAASIIKSKTIRSVKLRDGVPVFTVKIDAVCDIAEIYGGEKKTVDKNRLEELSGYAEKHLQKEISSMTDTLYRDIGADVPGMSRLLYIFKPSFYRENKNNLNTVMRESRYNVEVNVTVRRVGHEFVKIK